jgi:hypothetical protein
MKCFTTRHARTEKRLYYYLELIRMLEVIDVNNWYQILPSIKPLGNTRDKIILV